MIARTVRTAVLVERQQDYVSASRLLGEGPARVMFGEILPNVLPAVLVEFTVRLGYAVFAVVTLSFLGFGIQPPTLRKALRSLRSRDLVQQHGGRGQTTWYQQTSSTR